MSNRKTPKTAKPKRLNPPALTGRANASRIVPGTSTGATEAVTTDRKGGAALLPVSAAPLSLLIPTPPSLNDMFANNKGGGRGRYPTKEYRDWERAALWQIARQQPHRFEVPVVLFAAIQRSALNADIDNRSKPTLDILKSAGVYKDDSRVTAIAFTWSLDATRLLIVPAMNSFRVRYVASLKGGDYGGWYFDRSEEEDPNADH